ncbi:MAG: hypothetical protein AB1938_02625 [Myxococcota bacterium]
MPGVKTIRDFRAALATAWKDRALSPAEQTKLSAMAREVLDGSRSADAFLTNSAALVRDVFAARQQANAAAEQMSLADRQAEATLNGGVPTTRAFDNLFGSGVSYGVAENASRFSKDPELLNRLARSMVQALSASVSAERPASVMDALFSLRGLIPDRLGRTPDEWLASWKAIASAVEGSPLARAYVEAQKSGAQGFSSPTAASWLLVSALKALPTQDFVFGSIKTPEQAAALVKIADTLLAHPGSEGGSTLSAGEIRQLARFVRLMGWNGATITGFPMEHFFKSLEANAKARGWDKAYEASVAKGELKPERFGVDYPGDERFPPTFRELISQTRLIYTQRRDGR